MRGTKSSELARARSFFRLDWGRIAGRKRVAFGVKPYESAICVLFPNVKQTKIVYVCFNPYENGFRLAGQLPFLQFNFQFGFVFVEVVAHVGDGK